MQKVPIFQGSWKCHVNPSLRSERLWIRDCPLFRLTQRPSNRSRQTDSTIWIKNTRTFGPFIQPNNAKRTIFQGSWKWPFCPSLGSERLRIRDWPLIRLTQRPSNRSRVTDSTIWIKNTRTFGPFIQQNHAKRTIFQGSWKWPFCPSLGTERLRIRDWPLIRLTQRPSNRSRVTDSIIWIKNTRTFGPFILQKHAKSTHFSRVWKMPLLSIIAVRETSDSKLPPLALYIAAF